MPQTAIASGHPTELALPTMARLRLRDVHGCDDFASKLATSPVFLLRKQEARVAKRVFGDAVIEAGFVGLGLRFGADVLIG